jgi:hypothetical protein
MTSLKQIEANRRNALRSTGPTTEAGKRRSRRNAFRHGLTAETVVEPLENPEDYKAFEMSITAEFDAQTAVERELVLRLASLLWRLRRSTAIETGLFQIQREYVREPQQQQLIERERPDIDSDPPLPLVSASSNGHSGGSSKHEPSICGPQTKAGSAAPLYQIASSAIALCFQRLADVDHGAFERLSRYETALWRQVAQLLFTLNVLTGRGRGQIGLRSRWFHPSGWQYNISSRD